VRLEAREVSRATHEVASNRRLNPAGNERPPRPSVLDLGGFSFLLYESQSPQTSIRCGPYVARTRRSQPARFGVIERRYCSATSRSSLVTRSSPTARRYDASTSSHSSRRRSFVRRSERIRRWPMGSRILEGRAAADMALTLVETWVVPALPAGPTKAAGVPPSSGPVRAAA
jgi:hypothetical protein